MMDDNHKHDLEWTTSDAQICNKASTRTLSKVTETFSERQEPQRVLRESMLVRRDQSLAPFKALI